MAYGQFDAVGASGLNDADGYAVYRGEEGQPRPFTRPVTFTQRGTDDLANPFSAPPEERAELVFDQTLKASPPSRQPVSTFSTDKKTTQMRAFTGSTRKIFNEDCSDDEIYNRPMPPRKIGLLIPAAGLALLAAFLLSYFGVLGAEAKSVANGRILNLPSGVAPAVFSVVGGVAVLAGTGRYIRARRQYKRRAVFSGASYRDVPRGAAPAAARRASSRVFR